MWDKIHCTKGWGFLSKYFYSKRDSISHYFCHKQKYKHYGKLQSKDTKHHISMKYCIIISNENSRENTLNTQISHHNFALSPFYKCYKCLPSMRMKNDVFWLKITNDRSKILPECLTDHTSNVVFFFHLKATSDWFTIHNFGRRTLQIKFSRLPSQNAPLTEKVNCHWQSKSSSCINRYIYSDFLPWKTNYKMHTMYLVLKKVLIYFQVMAIITILEEYLENYNI